MTASGVHFVRAARPGKPIRWYIYAWRGGPRVRVAEQPGKPSLTREDIAAIAAAHAANSAPADTVSGLSIRWAASPEFKRMAPSTRDLWNLARGRIEAKWGHVPLRIMADPRMRAEVLAWRNSMADTPRAADTHLTVLRAMLGWALLRGLVRVNVADGVPALWQGGNREEIIWLPEDCAAFDSARIGKWTTPQWLIDLRRLAEFTGLRRADLVGLTWAEVAETHIARTASKKAAGKRRRVVMPVVPGLRALLDELRTRPRQPGVETVLVNTTGRAIKATTASVEFIRWRSAANGGAGINHPGEFGEPARAKTLHDLRGTFATKLMTLPGGGLSDSQIEGIMGWGKGQASTIRRRYVDEAAIVVAIGQRIAAGAM